MKYAKEEFDSLENVRCFTCDKVFPVKGMQNGHYIPRQFLNTRYDEYNCHPQCYACNMLYGGMIAEYRERLIKKYGEKIADQLLEKQRKCRAGDYKKFTIEDYEEMIKQYELKTSLLQD